MTPSTPAVRRPNCSSSGPFPKTLYNIPVTHPGTAPGFQSDELEVRRSPQLQEKEQPDTLPFFSDQLNLKGTSVTPVRDSKKRTVRQDKESLTHVGDLQDSSKRVCLDLKALLLELGDFQDISTAPSTTQQVAISLAGLPNELLTMLYGYVQKTVDVVHLSMTCKPLNELLSPRIMTDTFIRNKLIWSIDFGLSQQYRLRQLTLGVWNKYMAEGHQLALKLQGPPLDEVTDDEDVVMTEPVDTQDNLSKTEQRVAMARGQWRYDVCAPTKLVINPLFGKFIQQCPVFSPTLDEVAQWMNNGPLVSHTDSTSGKTLVSYMQRSDAGVRIMICNQTNCSETLAIVPETFWRPTQESLPTAINANQPVHLSQMVQIMSMKFYPQQKNQGKIRVLIVIAFGRGSYNLPPNAGMAAANNNGTQDTNLLEIWEVIKVS